MRKYVTVLKFDSNVQVRRVGIISAKEILDGNGEPDPGTHEFVCMIQRQLGSSHSSSTYMIGRTSDSALVHLKKT